MPPHSATKEHLAATTALARSLLAEALGMCPTPMTPDPERMRDSRRRWTANTISQAAEAFVEREGHFPTRDEWHHAKRWGLPAFDTVRRYWGSTAGLYQAIEQRRRLRQVLISTEEE